MSGPNSLPCGTPEFIGFIVIVPNFHLKCLSNVCLPLL